MSVDIFRLIPGFDSVSWAGGGHYIRDDIHS